MSTDKRTNHNDLTTGDRLYDSGVGTDGEVRGGESETGDPQAESIERNYSTYAAEATEGSDAAKP